MTDPLARLLLVTLEAAHRPQFRSARLPPATEVPMRG
jgi:hypothetical protein